MAKLPKTKCGPCCLLDNKCGPVCLRCKPQGLCAHATITPGPGITDACCRVDFGIWIACLDILDNPFFPGQELAWYGEGICESGAYRIAISVHLERDDYGSCVTVLRGQDLVSTPYADQVYAVFDGVLPVGMSISITDIYGNVWDVTVGAAAMVPNPLASDPCAPCSCAVCMPAKYSVHIGGPILDTLIYPENPYSGSGNCNCSVTTTLTYDCGSRSWLGSNLICGGHEFEFVLELMPASSGVCGVRFIVSFDGYEIFNEVIPFEGGLDSRKFGGTICSGNGSVWKLGHPQLTPCEMIIELPDPENPDNTIPTVVPCPDPPPQEFSTFLSGEFNGYPQNPILNYNAYDGDYEISLAQEVCTQNDDGVIVPCCGCISVPKALILTVHALCTALDGIEVHFTANPCGNGWHARTTSTGDAETEYVYWNITCGLDGSGNPLWRIEGYYFSGGDPNNVIGDGTFTVADSASCDPFHLHFSLTSTTGFFPFELCQVDGHLEGNMTFDVVPA